jgi:hypothetical protein
MRNLRRLPWGVALLVVSLACISAGQQPDPESGHDREPRRHALAELQRLSQLASEILRAGKIRSCLGPWVATGTTGTVGDQAFQGCGEERARSGGLRRFALGDKTRMFWLSCLVRDYFGWAFFATDSVRVGLLA